MKEVFIQEFAVILMEENLDSCVMIRFIQQNGENLTFRKWRWNYTFELN